MKLYTIKGQRKKEVVLINNTVYYKKHLTEEEVISEVLASCIGRLLGFKVVENYQESLEIVYSKQYPTSLYENIVQGSKYTIDQLLELQGIQEMLVFDFIILNIDRHINNIEVIDSSKLTHLFDFNLSLLSTVSDESLLSIDYLYNPITQNFNSKSLQENLNLINSPIQLYRTEFDATEFKHLFKLEEWRLIEPRVSILVEIINKRINYLITHNYAKFRWEVRK